MRSDSGRWWALATLCLSQAVVFMANSVPNVAIPTLIRELAATPSEVQWIVDAYVLVFAGLLLTSGKLGDRFGRKGVMTAGLVTLGGGSFLAALATNSAQLISARAIMGIGGALIVPQSLSILVNVFTEQSERRRAIAYWSLTNAAGIFVGPVAGGFLLRHFWWGSCFLMNVPVVLITILLGRKFIPTSRDPNTKGFDLPAAAMSSATLAVLLWAIIEGPAQGWTDPVTLGAFSVAAVLGVSFVSWELRVRDPMLDVGILRSRQLSAAATAMTVVFVAMTGSMFLVTQSLQLVKAYTPLAAALAISGPIVAVNLLVVPRAPGLTERFGARWMVVMGAGLTCCGALVIASTTADSGYANLLIGFATMALAFSLFVPATTEAIITAVPPERSGGASALNQLTRQLGQALGVAIAGSIAASGYRTGFVASQDLPNATLETAGTSITEALQLADTLDGAEREALLDVAYEAFISGQRLALVMAAVLALVAAVFAALAIPSRRLGRSASDVPARSPLAAGDD